MQVKLYYSRNWYSRLVLIGQPDNDSIFWLAGLAGVENYSVGYVVCFIATTAQIVDQFVCKCLEMSHWRFKVEQILLLCNQFHYKKG